ncbi:arabinose efflux permease family protein [Phyllobacterium sp. YR531]|nr:arabinose efflux permease family protein [Phyllobacterium sp. YR531]
MDGLSLPMSDTPSNGDPQMSPVSTHPNWLVGNPTLVQQWAALWIGSAGLLVLGLQPILLGALFSEQRVNFDELALIATAEFIMIALGSILAATVISTKHLRIKSATLMLLLGVLNYAVSFATTANELLLVRSIAGLVEGGTVAVSIELITRCRHTERMGGYFISLQTLAQCALAALLALWIVPLSGSNGGFNVLAIVCFASITVALLVPAEYEKLIKQKDNLDGVFTLRSALALLAIFSFFLFIGSLWAFLEPLGAQYGIDARHVGMLVSISLGVQVAGAICATLIDRRLDYRVAMIASVIAAAGAALTLGNQPSMLGFWVSALVVAFLWMFITPYQIALTVAADKSRATALLLPAAQLLGAALGPIGASLFIINDDVGAVPYFGVAALSCSLSASCVLLILLAGNTVTLDTKDKPY